jgi:hypothetical protein
VLWASPAAAHTVALLRPPGHSASTTELLERLRGELLSVGFEVTVRERPKGGAPGSEFWWRLASEGQVEAAVELVEELPLGVDVWVIDGERHFQLMARVNSDPTLENPSKGLAIRASEVLRARFFETREAPAKRPPAEAPTSKEANVVPSEPSRAQQPGRFGLELGAAALTSLDGVGPALLPIVRLDWAMESELLLQATFAGFGTRSSIETAAGSAQVAMQYGLLGACYQLDWQSPVSPLGALSVGALRTEVVGQAELPREGHAVDQWSFLLDASLGAAFHLSRRYTVALAGHVQLAEPAVGIYFGERRVASAARPNLLLTLTFGAWL